MQPILQFVLVVVSAGLGARFGSEGSTVLGALLGLLTGLGVGQWARIRGELERTRTELGELRVLMTRLGRPQSAPRATGGETEQDKQAPAAPTTPKAPPVPSVASPSPGVTDSPPAPTTLTLDDFRTSARRQPGGPNEPARARELSQPGTSVGSRRPGEFSSLLDWIRDYFTGGDALVRTGVVVLLFGVGFLLRYLAEHTHIPIQFRLSGIALGAVMLLVMGWRLRASRLGYALALQGGGVGILYLVVFSALRLYSLLSPVVGFELLVAICILTAALAVLQDSLAVALLAVTGGFLAPFLASTDQSDHVILFSYFLLLNLGIAGIAWFRSWKLLNLAGFAFTFVLSTAWGVLQYRPEDFASTEPFLVGLFLLYVAIAVLYGTRQRPGFHRYFDGTLIFGVPLVAFGLQAAMLQNERFALAYSALAVSGLYGVLAWVLHRRRQEQQRLLVDAFSALSVAFVTLAVPLALNAQWNAAAWAFEGCALTWVGCRQDRRLARVFGGLLQVGAGLGLGLASDFERAATSGTHVAALMVGIASIYAGTLFHRSRSTLAHYESAIPDLLFLWGLLWWCTSGLGELPQYLGPEYHVAIVLAFLTGTAVGCSMLAARTGMRIAVWPAIALLPVMLLSMLWAVITLHHPLAEGGWIAWPLAFLGTHVILKQQDQSLRDGSIDCLHAAALWLLAAVVSLEGGWHVAQAVGHKGAWFIAMLGLVPAIMLVTLPVADRHIAWPFQARRHAYDHVASIGLSLYLAVWSLLANATIASPSVPLTYLPLLNPLDLVQAGVILVLIQVYRRWSAQKPSGPSRMDPQAVAIALTAVAFVQLNAMLLRTLHLWLGVPYDVHGIMQSTVAQSALSLLWALTALPTMLVATRVHARAAWLMGAGLLGLVVIKLFVIDLASIGTVERIVSFIGVGLLMLVIGYYSPLPPASSGEARTETSQR